MSQVTGNDITGLLGPAIVGAGLAYVAPMGASTTAERALHGALLLGGLVALTQGSQQSKTMLTMAGVGMMGFVIWRAFFKNPEPVAQEPLPTDQVTSGMGRLGRLPGGRGRGVGYMNYGSYAHVAQR